jgi:hydroxyethylthiazole kinase-like uncharacterized protein yjeF
MTAPDPLLTAAQMRAIERAAIESGATDGDSLMRRAGEACVRAALARWPGAARVVVLCGPGNNGGDGYVIARGLAERGATVSVFHLGDPAALPPDAAAARARWLAAGGGSAPLERAAEAGPCDLLVDALFGAGLGRAVGPEVSGPLRAVAARATLAVDGPSGLCLDTGRARGAARPAELTVTFHRAKRGHFLADGPALCGALEVADIGLAAFADRAGGAALPVVRPDAAALRRTGGHKYDHGHALVLAGGVGRGGAGRLAARAALRVGAGLATVGAPGAALIENAARLDAVMLRRCDGPEDLAALLADARITTVALGPGLGVGDRTVALAEAAVSARGARGVVLDADALTSLAAAPAARDALFAACRGGAVVMTPHWGEFRRLFPAIAEDCAAAPERGALRSRVDAAEAAARESGATVLLKGPDTVIAPPDGAAMLHAAVYDDAAPWLATAGAGDVLTGLIAGLLARGLPAPAAAAQGAWLHAAAARAFGPGLIAEDLPEALPHVLASLEVARAAPLGAAHRVG